MPEEAIRNCLLPVACRLLPVLFRSRRELLQLLDDLGAALARRGAAGSAAARGLVVITLGLLEEGAAILRVARARGEAIVQLGVGEAQGGGVLLRGAQQLGGALEIAARLGELAGGEVGLGGGDGRHGVAVVGGERRAR